MFAVAATSFDPENPLNALTLGEQPDTEVPEGWVKVNVRAASLNHHDIWSLKGVGLREDRLPMILGCDAAGVLDDGTPVVVHGVVGDPNAVGGDETLDPKRSLLSEIHPGTFAETVAVPVRNVLAMPTGLTFAEAACLARRMRRAFKEERNRDLQNVSDRLQPAGANTVGAFFVFLDLLKGQAKGVAELFLTHAQHHPAHAHA